MIASTIAREHSSRVGNGLAAAELHIWYFSVNVPPPSWRMPRSNETRVRVEGFSKIIAQQS